MPSPFKFPDPKTTVPSERFVQRALEIIPGTLTWITLIGLVSLSFLYPVSMAVFIIAFDIYWILRTVFIVSYSVISYRKLRWGKNVDWQKRVERVAHPERYLEELEKERDLLVAQKTKTPLFPILPRHTLSQSIFDIKKHIKEVRRITQSEQPVFDWKEVLHVVAFPTAVEGPEIIEPAIQSVADSAFPKDRIIILLATEENEPEERRLQKVEYLKKKFDGVFLDFLVTTHKVEPGELKCKASNMTYAAKQIQTYCDKKNIRYERVIFSNFDCDTVCHPQYFSALTYFFCIDPKRLQRAYQPLPMYNNNLWDTNAFVRVIVLGSSFWHMFQGTRKEMVTFSSHSESFATLVNVGFWPVNMISEDSIIFWKAFSYYHGEYQTRIIPLPISLDAVLAETYPKTILNQYKQLRRWAYGIENFPVVMRALFADTSISWKKRFRAGFEILEGNHSWATSPLILACLGWLPLILGGEIFNQSVLAHNLPSVTGKLMAIAMFGLVVSISLTFLLLPPKPARYSNWRYAAMLLQWAIAPIMTPFLGSLPAIDSQTRLMFGKYFGAFWVTEKIRKREK